jgi:UDP-glucose 4-epimerase
VYGSNMGLEHVIPELIKKILLANKHDKIVNIQGSGNETRAFCYIDDAIDQMILASNDVSDNAAIYNIGTQNEISIYALATMIANIMNIDIKVVGSVNKPMGGTNRRCPDMTKIKNLGYLKDHNLDDGLKTTVEWYKDYYLNINE